ncbi:NlpE N-terminal domain-containing protein [Belliella buryatensis]|uniref:NlpE N-terminal domain-containing protein n=1 Tax=Belliella buryatensis TaxID=1500549 RepID=A0A239C624_9BACT|nr:copper resistance protein NlpE [Belliella buryatensis]SNS15560.1 NlpE N-terminal domain-containing protein [Belliella buryatensis]
MKKQLLNFGFVLAMASMMISCQKSKETENLVIDDEMFETGEIPDDFIDHHTAMTSLDYMGIYKGVLPCADCEGIETIIELGSGNSYVKKVIYLGKGDQKVIESGGTFTWNDDGNTITLNEEDAPNMYFVGENVLFHLDLDGNRIEGELASKYRLEKTS